MGPASGVLRPTPMRDLAVALISPYQGVSLLTNTFRDPELMVRKGRRLERWIDSLAQGSNSGP
jgi:TetR/AcrR family transcriptional repressor of nem operon